jgi:hypothetical protein
MKRVNSQSQSIAIKRGHLRFKKLENIFNEDGSNKIIRQRRTARGYWVNT